MAEVNEHANRILPVPAVVGLQAELLDVRREILFLTGHGQANSYRCIALSISADAMVRLIRLGPQPVNRATVAEKDHLIGILYVIRSRFLRN